jgi:probable HAF family extracellular repeat protein
MPAFALLVAGMLLLNAGVASAKKPPKPPPEPSGPEYMLIDLGHLGGGASRAWAINEAGQVVGNASDGDGWQAPFLVTPEDTDGDGKPDRWFRDDDADGVNDLMISLGWLGGGEVPGWGLHYGGLARDINDNGQVVGWSSWNGMTSGADLQHAFFWEDLDGDGQADPGEMVDLGVSGVGVAAGARAINNEGHIVASAEGASYDSYLIAPADTDGDGTPDCWFEDEDGDGLNDLMVHLGRPFLRRDINDEGLVVGRRSTSGRGLLLIPEDSDGDGVPDLWWRDDDGDDVNDLVVELSPLGTGMVQYVEGLNASGQIAGSSTNGSKRDPKEHAVRWESDLTPTDLGVFKDWSFARSTSVNDGGDVVGYGKTTKGVEYAFLWKDGTMHKLLDLLTNGDGITMIHANDINNSGLIVGYTNQGAFIAIPTGN